MAGDGIQRTADWGDSGAMVIERLPGYSGGGNGYLLSEGKLDLELCESWGLILVYCRRLRRASVSRGVMHVQVCIF